MHRIKKILQQYSDKPVDESVIKSIIKSGEIKSYKKGEIILTLGERYQKIGYVLKGIVRSYYLTMDGNEMTKNFHVENHMLMDESLFSLTQSICTYEVLEDCELFLISGKELKEIIMRNESLKDIYIACMEEGMRYKIYRENSFMTQSATERYINFRKQYPDLEKRVKQCYIATYLGIAPESLSRIRRVIREEK